LHTISLDPEEVLGCFDVDVNGFGPGIRFYSLSGQPFYESECPATTTTTTISP